MANTTLTLQSSKAYVDYVASIINSEAQTMTSLQIAEITNKRHDAVLRDIRNLLEQGVQPHNFVELFNIRQLPNGGSKQEPYYRLTKTGCLILASGYNAILREKIINRWIELETANQPKAPTSFREAPQRSRNRLKSSRSCLLRRIKPLLTRRLLLPNFTSVQAISTKSSTVSQLLRPLR